MAHQPEPPSSNEASEQRSWQQGRNPSPKPADNSAAEPNGESKSLQQPRHEVSNHSRDISRYTCDFADENGTRREALPSRFVPVRTLPGWIRSVEYAEDDAEADQTARLLLLQPDGALVAHHNHTPYDRSTPRSEPQHESTIATAVSGSWRQSRWQTFSQTSAYPLEAGLEEKLVTSEWLEQHCGSYSAPWRGRLLKAADLPDSTNMRLRKLWFERVHSSLLRSPLVPLVFRLTVWVFSIAALALGGSILYLTVTLRHDQGSSALMAIIVDAVALVYLVYITWDEYSSKPLGLRSPSAKTRLILLDLFFIVFDSANLALAFESVTGFQGACRSVNIDSHHISRNDAICGRQKALASVLLVALLAWLVTFAISVLRLVERVSH